MEYTNYIGKQVHKAKSGNLSLVKKLTLLVASLTIPT